MKPSDAKLVLRSLFGAYRTTADEATVAMYAAALLDCDLDVAMEAVGVLVRTENYLPSIARLREQYRIEQRRTQSRVRELAPGRPRNWQAVQLAGVRAALDVLHKTTPPPSLTEDLEPA